MTSHNADSSSGSGSSSAKVGQLVPAKNISSVWTKKLLQEVSTGGAGAGKTWAAILKAPCPDFTHVRLWFANQEATAGIITKIAVAVTNSNADKVTASTGTTLTNDGATGWVQGKFAGANGVTLGAAGADVNNASMTASDWIPINSIAPTDGSTLPYLLARVIYSNTFSYLFQGADASTTDKTKSQYIETYHTGGSVDAIADPTQLTAGNASFDPATPLYAFEFLSSKTGIRTVCIGDSITQGYAGSQLTAGGWWQQAQDLLIAAGYGINLFQGAIGGTTTTQYAAFGKTNVANFKPAVALYSLISPNNGPSGAFAGGLTQKIMDLQFQTAMDFANYCRLNETLPIFTILTPNDNYSSADDAFRLAVIARAKAAGVAVIDLTPAIATTANPQRFQSGFTADTVHPVYAANTLMAQSFVSQYIGILAQSGKLT